MSGKTCNVGVHGIVLTAFVKGVRMKICTESNWERNLICFLVWFLIAIADLHSYTVYVRFRCNYTRCAYTKCNGDTAIPLWTRQCVGVAHTCLCTSVPVDCVPLVEVGGACGRLGARLPTGQRWHRRSVGELTHYAGRGVSSGGALPAVLALAVLAVLLRRYGFCLHPR